MAATFDVTPANGGANTVGTLERTANMNGFLITINNGSGAAVDLRAVDGSHGSVYDMILREINPVMAHATNDANGTMFNRDLTVTAQLGSVLHVMHYLLCW